MKVGRTTLLVGTGGVGKTSTSAALALAAAHGGQNVACISLDPARRLADALGLEESTEITAVPNVANGRLRTWMPDSRTSVHTLLSSWLPVGDPLLDNHIVRLMGDALGGMHELASLVHLPMTLPEGLDHLVIDTAPGIHALEALSAPQRVRDLFEGPFIKRLIQLFNIVNSPRRRSFFFASQRIIDTMSRAFGERLVTQLSDLMSGLGRLQPKFLAMAEESQRILRSPQTKAYVVTVPSKKAAENALRVLKMLESNGFSVAGILVNRTPVSAGLATTDQANSTDAGKILAKMRAEANMRAERADQTVAFLKRCRPRLPLICLPECAEDSPSATVHRLSLEPALVGLVDVQSAAQQIAHRFP
ncbi:MAG: ArsA-related P-loop ATPase [Myxococcota bacterium]|nr:ArsA-related P-loop ATPase [Myxococcota bacterium]